MNHLTSVVAASLLLAAGLGAQNLTEKIDVSIVNVDVTVTSKGSPARGLTRDDFEVLEDGVPQAVTHFYAIENARESAATATPAAVAATPVTVQPALIDERFRRKVLVVIDNRHMSIHDRDVALRNIERFINDRFETGAYEWSIAMIADRVHLLLPLTSDKTRIHGALAEIRGIAAGRTIRDVYQLENRTAPMVREDSIVSMQLGASGGGKLDGLIAQSNRMQAASDAVTTYDAVLEAARSFANAPGRKIILLMTGSFAAEEDLINSFDPGLSSRHNAGLMTLRTWLVREANASDVSVSVINTEGLIPSNIGAEVGGSQGPDFNGSRFASIGAGGGGGSPGAFYWIARQTGGQSFMGNYVDRSLRDFDVASSNFYSLGYRPPHVDDGKYHSITVRLKKSGSYALSYRNGYGSVSVEKQLERAMHSTMAAEMQPSSIALSLTMGPAVATDVRGAVLIPLYTAVAAKELQFVPTNSGSVARVDIFISVFNESGGLIRTFRTLREAHATTGTEDAGNFTEQHALRLRKGAPYRVVVAVHDQVSDAVGIKSEMVRF